MDANTGSAFSVGIWASVASVLPFFWAGMHSWGKGERDLIKPDFQGFYCKNWGHVRLVHESMFTGMEQMEFLPHLGQALSHPKTNSTP